MIPNPLAIAIIALAVILLVIACIGIVLELHKAFKKWQGY